jgi:hypothetical protein
MQAASTPTSLRSVLTSAEWDHPDVFADLAAVVGTFEAWLRRTRVARRSWQRQRRGQSRPRPADRLARLDPGYALVDQAPDGWLRPGHRRPLSTPLGPATALLGRATKRSENDRCHGLDPLAGPLTTRLRPQAGTTRRTPWPWRGPPPLGITPRTSRRTSPRSRASADASSGWRQPASWSMTTTGTTRQPSRDPLGRSPGELRASGPSTAVDLPRTAALAQFADVIEADAVAIANVWAGRPDDDSLGRFAAAIGRVRSLPGLGGGDCGSACRGSPALTSSL